MWVFEHKAQGEMYVPRQLLTCQEELCRFECQWLLLQWKLAVAKDRRQEQQTALDWLLSPARESPGHGVVEAVEAVAAHDPPQCRVRLVGLTNAAFNGRKGVRGAWGKAALYRYLTVYDTHLVSTFSPAFSPCFSPAFLLLVSCLSPACLLLAQTKRPRDTK